MQLTNLMADLTKYWPNLKGTDKVFWEFEWTKHGTCSGKTFNQNQYFKLTLSIMARINVTNVLASAGFNPNNNVSYDVKKVANSIKNEIMNKFKVVADPEISCYNFQKKSYISEVRLYLDSMGVNFISCPIPFTGACANLVTLPS